MIVIEIIGRREKLKFEKDEITIGRQGGTLKKDILFQANETKISRDHCKIIRLIDGYSIIDLNSTNGTYVNGKKIKEAFLKEGDVISLGKNGPQLKIVKITLPEISSAKESKTHKELASIKPKQYVGVTTVLKMLKTTRKQIYRKLALIFSVVLLFILFTFIFLYYRTEKNRKIMLATTNNLANKYRKLLIALAQVQRKQKVHSIQITSLWNQLKFYSRTYAEVKKAFDEYKTAIQEARKDFSPIISKYEPAIVKIIVYKGNKKREGTGFCISDKGYLLSNKHVVTFNGKPPDKIRVRFSNDIDFLPANIWGLSDTSDLALLKVSGKKSFPYIPLNFNENPVPGKAVITLGFPMGSVGLKPTATAGIISKVESGVIQYDLATNPGNSGGPVLDIDGNLIAIHFAGAGLKGKSPEAIVVVRKTPKIDTSPEEFEEEVPSASVKLQGINYGIHPKTIKRFLRLWNLL